MPDDVTRIEAEAFLRCKNLKSIIIHDSVKSITIANTIKIKNDTFSKTCKIIRK